MIAGYLSLGFGPFFFGAGLKACIAMGAWLVVLAGPARLSKAV